MTHSVLHFMSQVSLDETTCSKNNITGSHPVGRDEGFVAATTYPSLIGVLQRRLAFVWGEIAGCGLPASLSHGTSISVRNEKMGEGSDGRTLVFPMSACPNIG
jgi:hypothetical protein